MHKNHSYFQKVILMVLLVSFLIGLTGCGGQVKSSPPAGYPNGTGEYAWWNDSVFYEIFVRSFYDSNGDGIGDFKGLTEKLDYLNDGDPKTTTDLGITGIWLMPINPSPSYHGYDVTDYYAVNPDYGTMDDFKAFLEAAHQRGIRVIMDLVINHTSVDHPWFAASKDPNSPYRSWYIWAKENPNFAGPWGQTVWHKTLENEYYYGIFWSGMPDLNYQTQAVTDEMYKITEFWLKEVGIDGFRVDGARHLIEDGKEQENTKATHEWYQEWFAYYKGIDPNAFTVGEVWTTNFAAVQYVKNKEFDVVFDFETAQAWVEGVAGSDARKISNATKFATNLFPFNQKANFLTNHDQNRVMSQFQGDVKKAKSAAVLLLTSPGIPFLYYGEEIGMRGVKPDEDIRTPMQWNSENRAGFTAGPAWRAVNGDYEEVNVAIQTDDPDSLLSLYRDLIRLRLDQPALRVGTYQEVSTDHGKVYAALRSYEGEAILILVNLDTQPVKDYQLSLDKGLEKGTYQMIPLLGEGKYPALKVNDQGGFSEYRPLAELPGGASLIIYLK